MADTTGNSLLVVQNDCVLDVLERTAVSGIPPEQDCLGSHSACHLLVCDPR